MKTFKSDTHWLIDAGLFTALVVSFCLDLTGVSLHQWLGMGIGVVAAVHLLAHWNWVKSVTSRLFGRTSAQARAFYWADASLLVGFGLIIVSGVVISTWLALPLENDALWVTLHMTVSVLVLLVVVLKIGLHWRWIVRVAEGRIFASRTRKLAKTQGQPAYSTVNTGRRQFLTLMGLVSLAAIASLSNVWETDQNAVAEADTNETGSSGELSSASTQLNIVESTSTSSCVVRCNRRCSYPGSCRRYTDANGNNLCDFGECA